MRKVIIGAVAFGLALISGAALAQMQGPAAPNYSEGGPTTGGTQPSGSPNAQTAQPTNPNARQGAPNARQGTLYNYAPGQGNNQAQPRHRRGTTAYQR
jgi:hypothetical protein